MDDKLKFVVDKLNGKANSMEMPEDFFGGEIEAGKGEPIVITIHDETPTLPKNATARERVVFEYKELYERWLKLSAFIDNEQGEKYLALSEKMQKLLLRQVKIMQDYLGVLMERLAIWEK